MHRKIPELGFLYLLQESLYHLRMESFILREIFEATIFSPLSRENSFVKELNLDSFIWFLSVLLLKNLHKNLLSRIYRSVIYQTVVPVVVSLLTFQPILTLTSCLSDSSESRKKMILNSAYLNVWIRTNHLQIIS